MKNEKNSVSSEIVSFNEQVPEVSALLDLDDSALDLVVGGLADGGCGQLSSCPNLTCIGKCGVNAKIDIL